VPSVRSEKWASFWQLAESSLPPGFTALEKWSGR
jgi:hypothetical protein